MTNLDKAPCGKAYCLCLYHILNSLLHHIWEVDYHTFGTTSGTPHHKSHCILTM
jgi:hypothetical protein